MMPCISAGGRFFGQRDEHHAPPSILELDQSCQDLVADHGAHQDQRCSVRDAGAFRAEQYLDGTGGK